MKLINFCKHVLMATCLLPSTTLAATFTYNLTYDGANRVTSVVVDNQNSANYVYRANGQLTQVSLIGDGTLPAGALQFSAADYSVGEADGNVTITANRAEASHGLITIDYATINGTAIAGEDYTATSGTLTWNDGDTTEKTFTVNISNDNIVEGNETFTIALSNPTGNATVGSLSSTTVTIVETALPQAELSLAQTDSVDPIETSASLSYTLTVNNAGPDAATNVQVVDTLPSGVIFGNASGTDWICQEASGTVTCELANLAVGPANPITVNVTAPSTAGDMTNQATVSAAGTTDPEPNNNSVSEITTVNNTPTPPSYTLSIATVGQGTVTGSGINCGTDCSAVYDSGENITLTTTPDSGWQFEDWIGDCGNGQVTINSDKSCTATFSKLRYTLTVTVVGQGIVTGNGINCGSNCSALSDSGDNVTLTAIPEDGWQFDSWSGDCDSNGQININNNHSCTAAFSVDPSYDGDNDSIPDTTENAAPNNGDGNGDGILDKQQAEVVSLPDALTGEYLTVAVANPTCRLTAVQALTKDSQPPHQVDYHFPQGLLGFTLECPQADITVYYHGINRFNDNTYRNYGPTTPGDSNSKVWYDLPNVSLGTATIDTKTVVTTQFTLKDGELGDDTGTDGQLVNTGGLALNPSFIGFSLNEYLVKENSGIAIITVTRTGSTVGEITVDYTTTDNTAHVAQDYQAASGTFIWRDGEQGEQTFNIVLLDNTTLEDDKTLTLSLGNLTGTAANLTIDTATLTIVENEIPLPGTPQLTAATVEVDESVPTTTFTISRVNGSDGELVVSYATMDGTATAGSDYVETSGLLSWLDGDNSDKTIMVTITDDFVDESDETFSMTLSDAGSGAHRGNSIITIKDNDINPTPPCPTRGSITVICDAVGQTLDNVTVDQGISLANMILAGTVHNQGWISNATVQPDAQLIGGIVSGTITNKGTMKDFEFRGALVKGGTLSGDITNNSKIGGTFQDVQLTAHTRISGGQLQGIITGDAQAPARLENVKVKQNSHLSGVILSDTIQLSDDVELGNGVRFTHHRLIPTDLELMALLPDLPTSEECVSPAQVKRVDLSQDVLESSEGILAAINALPNFKDNNWVMTQSAECGYLQLTIGASRFAVQPLSVTSTSDPTALELLDQQQVRFTTETGLTILTQPAVQAQQTLQASLAERNLSKVIWQSNGNLSISAYGADDIWFSARPDWRSIELSEETVSETGLFLTDSPHVRGIFTAYVVFTDQPGKHRQQYFHSALAMPEVLYSTAQQVVIEPDGAVSFKLGGQSYRGVVDYLVTKGTPPTADKLQVEATVDVNGDGKEDWVLIYPNGERQTLFQNLP